jgi:RNA polymerase sigma-70 factor, ECF subfamily
VNAKHDCVLELLCLARDGDASARGRLLELYRNYLRSTARSLVRLGLRAKLDPSDAVQETYLKAVRDFGNFLGTGDPELVAWLRQILLRTLTDQARYHRAQGRNHRRQDSLDAMLGRSSEEAHHALADPSPSPSGLAIRREHDLLIAEAIEKLPEDYRRVVTLRNLERVPIEEIAVRMGRAPNAVRKLWTRALLALRRELEAAH